MVHYYVDFFLLGELSSFISETSLLLEILSNRYNIFSILASISLSSTVSITSEIIDWVVEPALPIDSTPKFELDQYYYKSYHSLLLQHKYLPSDSRFSICYQYVLR